MIGANVVRNVNMRRSLAGVLGCQAISAGAGRTHSNEEPMQRSWAVAKLAWGGRGQRSLGVRSIPIFGLKRATDA